MNTHPNPKDPQAELRPQLYALLHKYFKGSQWYDGEIDQTLEAIEALFQAHQQELDQARELLQSDLRKFNELWTIWGVEHGIDFNMEAIENYLQSKIGELNG